MQQAGIENLVLAKFQRSLGCELAMAMKWQEVEVEDEKAR
jgi:hypothetical protein